MTGRIDNVGTADRDETLRIVERFNDAFNRHDVEGLMALMTDDCIFENTSPAPDGERHVGAKAVRAFWDQFFGDSGQAVFLVEDIFAASDRCFVQWIYQWSNNGDTGHVRGVDLFRVRDGKVAEKLSYVKG